MAAIAGADVTHPGDASAGHGDARGARRPGAFTAATVIDQRPTDARSCVGRTIDPEAFARQLRKLDGATTALRWR